MLCFPESNINSNSFDLKNSDINGVGEGLYQFECEHKYKYKLQFMDLYFLGRIFSILDNTLLTLHCLFMSYVPLLYTFIAQETEVFRELRHVS